jgi:hypothetical protein
MCKCILAGLAIFSGGFVHRCNDTVSPPKTTPGDIVNLSQNYGLESPSTLCQYVYNVSKQKFPEIQPPSSLDRGFFHDIVLQTVEAITYPCKSPSDASSEC